jgi:acyl-ACP thioesterase
LIFTGVAESFFADLGERPVAARGYRPPMADPPAVRLDPAPPGVRLFEARRPVRFGDVDRRAELRLDALAAYLQDVAGDDTNDVGLRDVGGWVVRRSLFEVIRPPAYGQEVTLTTWASGAGSRWAERRLSVAAPGPRGPNAEIGDARIEGVSLWVFVDPLTLRPAPLDAGFTAVYAPATRGRTVSSRLSHPPAPDAAGAPVEQTTWVVRAADIDPYGHVNNAATWAVVEEVLAARPVARPFRAELEYRVPIEPGTAVVVDIQAVGPTSPLSAARADGSGFTLWVRDRGGALFATARVTPLAG